MDRLISFYEQLRKLRNAGMKMKELAETLDVAPSVLSSLYCSVLPSYINLRQAGTTPEQALDKALQTVNNLSKRKLTASLDALHQQALHISPRHVPAGARPFFEDLETEALKYLPQTDAYHGLYLAYSCSSANDGLKIEPYLITRPAAGESMPQVYCLNSSDTCCTGIGIFSDSQIGYLLFNEQQQLQLALRIIYLQLPMLRHPEHLKGIYLTHDFNRNPIARRILLVRQGDEISLDGFRSLHTVVLPREQLDETQMAYYEYTCQPEDILRSYLISSPGSNLKDLTTEKEFIRLTRTPC